MTRRYAHALFCDDIRYETSGKITLVGTYSDALLASSFPLSLPKLCVRLTLVSPTEDPYESLEINFFLNDKPLGAPLKLTGDEIQEPQRADKAAERASDQSLYFDFVFSPIAIEGPGSLRVVIYTDRGELTPMPLLLKKHEHNGSQD